MAEGKRSKERIETTKHPGIYKRTSESGAIWYQAKVRLRGHPTVSESFKRLTDAVRWKAQTITEIKERRHFKNAEAQKHTVGDLCERYTADVLPTKADGTRTTQQRQLTWWASELGSHTLADCTPAPIACRASTMPGPLPGRGAGAVHGHAVG